MQPFDPNKTNIEEILYQINYYDSGELAFEVEGDSLDGSESLPYIDQICWKTKNSTLVIERLKSIREKGQQTQVWIPFKSIETLKGYLRMYNITDVMTPTKP